MTCHNDQTGARVRLERVGATERRWTLIGAALLAAAFAAGLAWLAW